MTEPVSEILELRGTLRDYAWGSPDFLSRWLGVQLPAGPEAEWWMGAHAAAPSQVNGHAGWIALSDWIAEDPARRLGDDAIARFGPDLSFLFKILAAEHPLSLQAHPDAGQARAGFEREEAAGVARDAAERNYRDPYPKPELLCALTPFDALVGFRSSAAILKDAEALANDALWDRLEPLRSHGDAGLRACFERLWTEPTEPWFEPFVEACRSRCAGAADALVVELAGAYPDDVGVIAPCLLNFVHLEPGEAIYLPARELHSYVRGAGLELMGNSDNVLRGGLTPKHVDVPELSNVLDFHARAPSRVDADERAPGVFVYTTPAESFELSRLEVRGHHVESNRRGLAILLCEEGRGRVSARGGAAGLELSRGCACAVSAAVGELEIHGELTLYRAGLPLG